MLPIALHISSGMLVIAFLLAFVRLLKGPGIYDRIVAMDLVASITAGFVLLFSLVVDNAVYIDIVITLSLISFIGSIAISTYLKQKNN